MTAEYEAFKKEVNEKLGGLTSQQYISANPGDHLYATYGKFASCAFCGRVKPRSKPPSICPGIIRVKLR